MAIFHSDVPLLAEVLGACSLPWSKLMFRPRLWRVYKLPMLGKLFSFSGKSSLYRTGSARCSTTLRGIVPKTEANLLMHSDLWDSGSRRAGEQMRGTGVGGKEKMFKRLRDDSKIHNIQCQQKNPRRPSLLPGSKRLEGCGHRVMWRSSDYELSGRQ